MSNDDDYAERMKRKFVDQPPPGMLPSGKLNIVGHRPLKADKPHLVIGERSRAVADAHAERLRAIVTPLAGQLTGRLPSI